MYNKYQMEKCFEAGLKFGTAKQIVIDKIKEYRERKKTLRVDLNTAIKFEFKEQLTKIQSDIRWVEEIIELINDIDSDIRLTEMQYKETKSDLPDKRRVLYITNCGRCCLGYFINDNFIEDGTSLKHKRKKVLFWIYVKDILPKKSNLQAGHSNRNITDMKPKDMAKDILDRMQDVVIDTYSGQFEKAKECALIAVNVILNDVGAKDWEDDGLTNSNYWQDVKSELNTLKQ